MAAVDPVVERTDSCVVACEYQRSASAVIEDGAPVADHSPEPIDSPALVRGSENGLIVRVSRPQLLLKLPAQVVTAINPSIPPALRMEYKVEIPAGVVIDGSEERTLLYGSRRIR